MAVNERDDGEDTDDNSTMDILERRDRFVVSNREPYTHECDGAEVTVSRSAGGLPPALDPLHDMRTRAAFDEEFWRSYWQVNETFADTILACGNEDDTERFRSKFSAEHEITDQFRGVSTGDDDATKETPDRQSTPVSVWSQRRWLADTLRDVDGLFVMTDFDGTVSDIVDDPAQAEIREGAKDALETFADHPQAKVAVISGREVNDVRDRTAIEDIYYVGNHGLELYNDGERSVLAAGQMALDGLTHVEQRFADVDGVFVENKGMTATIHFRQTEKDVEPILRAVRSALDEHKGGDGTLRVTRGKKIVELGPDIDWGKGDAIEVLRKRFIPEEQQWLPVYIGDDTTDEDALEAVEGDGLGVVVGSDTDATAASCIVSDPGEATDFLKWLADEGLDALEAKRREDTTVADQLSESRGSRAVSVDRIEFDS